LAGGFEDRLAGVEADLGDAARMEKIGGRQAGTGGLQAKAGKAVEDDPGEPIEIADEEGEEADIERLLLKNRRSCSWPSASALRACSSAWARPCAATKAVIRSASCLVCTATS
jgi:hypothetical protein